jgi:hypothetical protein
MIISLMLGIPKLIQVPQLLFLASSKSSAERWVSADMVDFVMSAVSDVEVQSAIRAEERQNVIDEESEIADDRVSYFDMRREHFWKLKIPDLVGLLKKANVKFKSSAHKKDLVVLAVESSILISGQEYPFPDRELLYYDRHGLWKHRTGQKSSKQGKTKVGNMWLDDADLVSDDDDVSACKIIRTRKQQWLEFLCPRMIFNRMMLLYLQRNPPRRRFRRRRSRRVAWSC